MNGGRLPLRANGDRAGRVDVAALGVHDWPHESQDFRVEPTRIFAVSESQVIVEAIHRGRSRKMGIEIEAEIFWLYRLLDGRTRRWEMFMSREATLIAARPAEQ
jgi:heme A synthase